VLELYFGDELICTIQIEPFLILLEREFETETEKSQAVKIVESLFYFNINFHKYFTFCVDNRLYACLVGLIKNYKNLSEKDFDYVIQYGNRGCIKSFYDGTKMLLGENKDLRLDPNFIRILFDE